jgi:hypothetical protein
MAKRTAKKPIKRIRTDKARLFGDRVGFNYTKRVGTKVDTITMGAQLSASQKGFKQKYIEKCRMEANETFGPGNFEIITKSHESKYGLYETVQIRVKKGIVTQPVTILHYRSFLVDKTASGYCTHEKCFSNLQSAKLAIDKILESYDEKLKEERKAMHEKLKEERKAMHGATDEYDRNI